MSLLLDPQISNMLGLFTILLIVISTSFSDRSRAAVKFKDQQEDYELVFTSILYRHGERNPDGFYAHDPYKNLSFWPDGLGALIDRGKIQQFKLGKWLRKRYNSLIVDGRYSNDLLYVQSTDVDRTIMSALANLAGMFYPTEGEMLSDLNWQPIPVHTVPKELDKELLIMLTKCPKIKEEEERLKEDPLIKEYNEEHSGLFDYMGMHTGERIKDASKARSIYINLHIESQTQDNFTIPDWARCIYPERLGQVSVFGLQMLTMSQTLKRLRGGPLLKEIIMHMKQKASGTLRQNLWIYSAHDVTVTCLLDAMGVFEPHIPPVAATVMIELSRDKKKNHFVSIHYKNSTKEPHLLKIPGCSQLCPLGKFEELLADVIPGDWEAECYNIGPVDFDFEDSWWYENHK